MYLSNQAAAAVVTQKKSNLAARSGGNPMIEIEAALQAKKQEIAQVGEWLARNDISHPRWAEGSQAYLKLQDDLIILDCKLVMAQLSKG